MSLYYARLVCPVPTRVRLVRLIAESPSFKIIIIHSNRDVGAFPKSDQVGATAATIWA